MLRETIKHFCGVFLPLLRGEEQAIGNCSTHQTQKHDPPRRHALLNKKKIEYSKQNKTKKIGKCVKQK